MKKRLLLIFAVFLLLLAVIGATYADLVIKKSEQETFENLQSISRLKAEQIASWINEREADAVTLKSSFNLALRIEQFIQYNKNYDRQILLSRIETMRQAYGYDSILLVDTHGQLLIGSGNNLDMPPVVSKLLENAMQRQSISHTDLFHQNRLCKMRVRSSRVCILILQSAIKKAKSKASRS